MKNIIIIGSILLVLLVLFLIFFQIEDKNKTHKEENTITDQHTDRSNQPISGSPYEPAMPSDLSSYVLNEGEYNSYDSFQGSLKSGRINFIWELWAIRRTCPKNYSPGRCDHYLLDLVDKKFPQPDNEKVKQLFEKYFTYEKAVLKSGRSQKPTFGERYQEVKQKRRQFFSEEQADLVFGIEESRVEFVNASGKLFQETKGLSGTERVKQYEQLQKKIYGERYEEMIKREDPFNRYQTELELRGRDMSKLSEKEKKESEYKLQIKYFGQEGADRIRNSQ